MPSAAKRPAYHHGDLRNALIAAGVELAKTSGPEAVGVRAAARQVGVSPTAAYRHFADANDLLVAIATTGHVSMSLHMQAHLSRVRAISDAETVAQQRIRAIGAGYIDFARSEPGLFRLAFLRNNEPVYPLFHDERQIPSPWDLLCLGVDGMVEAGLVPRMKADAARIGAWSAVHGISTLLVDGFLVDAPASIVNGSIQAVIDMAMAGLGR